MEAVIEGHGTRYRALRWKLINALVKEGDDRAAAEKVGLHPRTVARWKQEDDFQRDLTEARKAFDAGQIEAIREQSLRDARKVLGR